MKLYLLSLGCLLFLVTSCRKEKNKAPMCPEPETPATPVGAKQNFMPLKAGNYWIYERFQVELNGKATSLNQFDSCYIIKDTTIRSHQYWILKKRDLVFQRDERVPLRDSAGCLVNHNGEIMFAPEHLGKDLGSYYEVHPPDTLAEVQKRMNDKNLIVKVPAGTFTTTALQIVYTMRPKYASPSNPNPRIRSFRYADGVGPVIETEVFFMDPSWMVERRLVRYKVN